ncbi:PREDICTED: cytochrome P450 CYP736A12-like [Ipomoea nil]|uniref:cytochrome P450 CYP736A12-like n=1 Tax=Ipomoea nil TaxID=35883 RepID=UPI000900BEE0|nr:PREDICTED: cytochrome P450 CYP736A12-like [Ipomoea nil]XP_019179052.1 PREDICTED: cytochrome P450 CYP736A12-like [Ipomoea nil]
MFPIVPSLLSILAGILLWFIARRWTPASSKSRKKLPPGPRGLPIIGNLHMLGHTPHRALNNLSKKYGPIMFLKLGSVPMVVISSPSAAELILKTHDDVFSNRPRLDAVEHFMNSSKGMAFSPPDFEWRKTKKFSIQELLNTAKIESFAGVRREEVGALLASIKMAAAGGEVVDLSEMVGELIENVTYKMLFGFSNDKKYGLKSIVHEVMALMGAFNIAEYVPFLKPFDLQGLYKRMKAVRKAMDNVVGEIINKHEEDARNGTKKGNMDFIDMMLSSKTLSSAHKLDQENIKSLLFELILGAIDTSNTWIEWTMAELLRNPGAMRRLQDELEANIGLDRMVEEKDLPKLQYLEMVIKETGRLHPPAPLLLPRESMEDIEINGYYIPTKSRVTVNAWAIGRDSSIWPNINADDFIPERFIDSDVNILGHDFVLLPFGYGKRMCPGAKLGLLNVKLIVSNLVHGFDWELPKGKSPSEMDMEEAFGLVTAKSKHLLAIPSYRLLC